MKFTFAALLLAVVYGALTLFSAWHLPFWWDEGWNALVASTWVKTGHYGAIVDGAPRFVGLCSSFLVIAPTALAVSLIGTEPWQVMLPFVALSIGAFFIYLWFAARMWGRTVAILTAPVLLLCSWHHAISPIFLGAQVLAEQIGLIFLSIFLISIHRWLETGGSRWLVPAAVGIALAAYSKTHFLLFGPVAGGALLLWLVALRRYRQGFMLCGAGVVAAGLWLLARQFEVWLRPEFLAQAQSILVNHKSVVYTDDPAARARALDMFLQFGPLSLVGLVFASFTFRGRIEHGDSCSDARAATSFVIVVTAAAWFAWYVFFSVGYPRYLAIPIYLSAPFVVLAAQVIYREMMERIKRRDQSRGRSALLRMCLIAAAFFTIAFMQSAATVYGVALRLMSPASDDLARLMSYLNTELPIGQRVETNEAEILYRLERPYHFPPDFIENDRAAVESGDVQRIVGGTIPDVIVTGKMEEMRGIYSALIKNHGFAERATFGSYRVFSR